MAYEAQLSYKASILTDQLTRIGKLAGLPAIQIIPSPNPYQYRNNLRFHVDETGKLGFLAPQSDRIIPVTECHLPENVIGEAWPSLEMEPESGIDQIELRCGADGDLLITFEGALAAPPEFETEAGLSAVYAGPGGRVILAGEDALTMQVEEPQFPGLGQIFLPGQHPPGGRNGRNLTQSSETG